MTNRTDMGKRLEEAMGEALEHARGNKKLRKTQIEVPMLDVAELRGRLDLTQEEFALRYGFSLSAVRHWEQGLRTPELAARLLLTLIRDETELVDRHVDQLRAS